MTDMTPNTLHADLSDALELLSKAVAQIINGPRSADDWSALAVANAKANNAARTHGAALLEAAGREWLIGTVVEADFERKTMTFEMAGDFTVRAGEYRISTYYPAPSEASA